MQDLEVKWHCAICLVNLLYGMGLIDHKELMATRGALAVHYNKLMGASNTYTTRTLNGPMMVGK